MTFGIGEAATAITQLAPKIAFQAVAHGMTQGVVSGIQGGNFWQGAASGALASIGASAWGGLGGNFARSGAGQITFGTISGGAGAALTGGNFWEGAATGFVVSALNHVVHNKTPRRDYKRYFRQAQERVGAQYADGSDFSLSKTALGTGGMLYGVGEHIITPGNQWLGLNGKYYNTSWGGNQWTGGRSRAFKVSGYYKLAGRVTFIGGALFSGIEGVNHINNGNYLGASKSGLDIGMGVLATYGGIPGLIVGGIYFAVDATIGWDNAFNNMENITTKTRAVHGSGWNPYKTHGWQP